MAPPHLGKQEREKRFKSLLCKFDRVITEQSLSSRLRLTHTAFVSLLSDRLRSSYTDPALINDLQSHIRIFAHNLSIPDAKRGELEATATELWNLSTRLHRGEGILTSKTKEDAPNDKIHTLIRVFTFLVLDATSRHGDKGRDGKSCLRLTKIAFKAAAVCLAAKDTDGATKVLERAADYQDVLEKMKHDDEDEHGATIRQLRAEYFLQRIILVISFGDATRQQLTMK